MTANTENIRFNTELTKCQRVILEVGCGNYICTRPKSGETVIAIDPNLPVNPNIQNRGGKTILFRENVQELPTEMQGLVDLALFVAPDPRTLPFLVEHTTSFIKLGGKIIIILDNRSNLRAKYNSGVISQITQSYKTRNSDFKLNIFEDEDPADIILNSVKSRVRLRSSLILDEASVIILERKQW